MLNSKGCEEVLQEMVNKYPADPRNLDSWGMIAHTTALLARRCGVASRFEFMVDPSMTASCARLMRDQYLTISRIKKIPRSNDGVPDGMREIARLVRLWLDDPKAGGHPQGDFICEGPVDPLLSDHLETIIESYATNHARIRKKLVAQVGEECVLEMERDDKDRNLSVKYKPPEGY